MCMHWIETKLLSNTKEFESYKILNQVYVYVNVYLYNFLSSSSALICCYFCVVNNIEVGVCKQVQMLEISLVTIF
jgi:hypothetical protein